MENVKRVYVAHTINTVALSVVSVYVPAYLLTLGYPLSWVILFYAVSHAMGLLFGLFIFVPLVQKLGLINTFKIYYPLQIIYLILLSILKTHTFFFIIIAIVNGLALFAYWIPMNIFLIKYSDKKEMGINLSRFFALPNLFGVLGSLAGAILIPFFGFWPAFGLSILPMITSFLPLAN